MKGQVKTFNNHQFHTNTYEIGSKSGGVKYYKKTEKKTVINSNKDTKNQYNIISNKNYSRRGNFPEREISSVTHVVREKRPYSSTSSNLQKNKGIIANKNVYTHSISSTRNMNKSEDGKRRIENDRNFRKIEKVTKIIKNIPINKPPIIKKKEIEEKTEKKELIDNYQYHETKNIKNTNPRFFVIVEHKRLGGPVGGIYQETYMERKVFSEGSNRPQITEQNSKISTAEAQKRLISNKSEANLLRNRFIVTNPEASETTVNKRTTKTTTTTTTTKNEGPKVKSETITQQKKITRRASGKQSTEVTTKTEIKGEKHEKPEEKLTTRSSRTTTEKVGNAGSGKKVQQSSTTTTTTKTTTTTTTKKGGNASENTGIKVETKKETKIEKKGGEVVEGGASSIRKKYAKGKREFQITKAV